MVQIYLGAGLKNGPPAKKLFKNMNFLVEGNFIG